MSGVRLPPRPPWSERCWPVSAERLPTRNQPRGAKAQHGARSWQATSATAPAPGDSRRRTEDPITGQRQQINRTVREPNAKSRAKAADIELARLIVEAESQRVLPSSGVTVRQLMERWFEHRRPGWEERSPGQPDATLSRIRNHITLKLGDVALDRLHSQSRTG
jgi:hypothetical protein